MAKLPLEGNSDEGNGDVPSPANLAIALAILSRCAATVLDQVLAEQCSDGDNDDGGLTAYAALVEATCVCYEDPETLVRDVHNLNLDLEKV